MTRLYLVTGFLGAGKTTFMKEYLSLFQTEKTSLIVNEFGKQGVDGALLSNTGATLYEVSGGSIFCSCRLDTFEDALSMILERKPDVILVEASGLSDPTSIGKVVSQEKFSEIDYKGCICLVDAVSIKKVFETARMVKKQLSVSDIVLINKIDLVDEKEILEIEKLIRTMRPDANIIPTSFGKIPEEKKDMLMNPPKEMHEEGGIHTMDITLRKFLIKIDDTFTVKELQNFLEMFALDTYRIKGFVKIEGKIYYAEGVGASVTIKPYQGKTEEVGSIVVLSGNGLPADKSIKEAAKWYEGHILSIDNKNK